MPLLQYRDGYQPASSSSLETVAGHLRDIFDTCRFFEVKKEKVPKPNDFGTFSGGDNRTRICDLSRVRRALYRLSYASIGETVVTRTGLEPVLPP